MIPFITSAAGGHFAFIRGHVSSDDKAPLCIKDRKFQGSHESAAKQIGLDETALNEWTAIDVHALLFRAYGIDLPIAAVSAAMQTLDEKVQARKAGPSKGPKVPEPVVADRNGRTLIRAVQDQKSGKWSLEICNAVQCWTTFVQMTDKQIKAHEKYQAAEAQRKLDNNIDGALTQSGKWLAQEVKKQSLSQVMALINKTIPCEKIAMRRFTLISRNGAITCDSISIGGHTFTDMYSMVSTFRPDLIPNFWSPKADQANG